jgi:hypothetical protein
MATNPPESRLRKLRRVFTSPGVRRFGLPWGITMALFTHGRDYGWAPASLRTEHFAVVLASWLLAGVLAGIFFQRSMRALGAPVDHVGHIGQTDREPPA